MIKRLLAFALLISFTTVQANVATENSLKAAFDELNYALSVEWDQEDRAFYNAEMKRFEGNIENLKTQGLSNSELIQFALKNVKDEQAKAELEKAFNMIELNKLDESEAKKLVMSTLGKTYSQGANYMGDVAAAVGAVLLVSLLVVAIALSPSSTSTGGGVVCYDEYYCYWDCDYWGYCYEYCYWDTYCY